MDTSKPLWMGIKLSADKQVNRQQKKKRVKDGVNILLFRVSLGPVILINFLCSAIPLCQKKDAFVWTEGLIGKFGKKLTEFGYFSRIQAQLQYVEFYFLETICIFSEHTVYWHYVVNIRFLTFLKYMFTKKYWFSVQWRSPDDDLDICIFTWYIFSLASKFKFYGKFRILHVCKEVVVEKTSMEWYNILYLASPFKFDCHM